MKIMRIAFKLGLAFLICHAITTYATVVVTNVSAGAGHCLFLKSDGTLWGMGQNDYGQLGDGTDGMFNCANRLSIITGSTGLTR